MSGVIPVLAVTGESVAETWEKSLLELWEKGCRVRTQYDRKDDRGEFIDPPSVDATLMMTVKNPASEPAIHRCFPGGLEDLEEYRQEVVDGIKDHWIGDPNNPDDHRWEYTYHDRLTNYKGGCEYVDTQFACGWEPASPTNQLDVMVEALVKSPISRRVQAITWQPWKDPQHFDPPCLQSIWCRILPDDDDVWHLNMNVRFRSRDAYKAAFMNLWALVCLQEDLAKRIAEKAGREVRLGHHCDLSDSYHIYGKDIAQFKREFLRSVESRSFDDRTWTREFAQEFFDEAKSKIREKVRLKDERDDRRV